MHSFAPQRVALGLAGRAEQRRDGVEAFRRAQRVAVAHAPERGHRPPEAPGQRRPERRQRVELPRGGLPEGLAHRREAVAVDRRRAGGDRAGRPLRRVVLVAGDAVLRRDAGRDHLEQVELRGHLEQRALELGCTVQSPHVADAVAHRAAARRRGRIRHAPPQLAQRGQLQPADAVTAAVRERNELVALDAQALARGVAIDLAEAGEAFEPVHVPPRRVVDARAAQGRRREGIRRRKRPPTVARKRGLCRQTPPSSPITQPSAVSTKRAWIRAPGASRPR